MMIKTSLLILLIVSVSSQGGIDPTKLVGKISMFVDQLEGCLEGQACVQQFISIWANADWPTKTLEFQLDNTETAEECFDQAAEFCLVEDDGETHNVCSEDMPPTWLSCDGTCIAYVEAAPKPSAFINMLKAITSSDHVQFVEFVEEVHSEPRLMRPEQAQVGQSRRPAELQVSQPKRPAPEQSVAAWYDRENYVASKERPISMTMGFMKESRVGKKGKWTIPQTDTDAAADEADDSVAQCEDLGHTWGLSALDGSADNTDNYNTAPTDGHGVFVYVLDTGFYGQWNEHEEYAGRVDEGKSFIGGESVNDLNSHGTHCAGTIGAKSYGVAKDVKIIPVKVLSNSGSGSTAGVMAGMEWVLEDAQARGAPLNKVLMSMSLGGGFSQAENNVVDSLVDAGITIVVAAGNENSDACTKSPASAPNAITVGSTTKANAKSGFSNWGTCVDILAPGSGVKSTIKNMEVAEFSGTSMACPHVAGVVASMYSRCDAMSAADVMTVFESMEGYSVSNVITGFSDSTNNLFVQNTCGESHCVAEDLSYWKVNPIGSGPTTTSGPKTGCVGVCGSANSGENCYCDDLCKDYNDCCFNYDELCTGEQPSPSEPVEPTDPAQPTEPAQPSPTGCDGLCGSSNGAEGCWCDDMCTTYGDCCPNYNEMCNGGPTPTEPAQPSEPSETGCDGNCGGSNSAEGCYCDSVCKDYGDCCPNYDDMCNGGSDPTEPAAGGCDGYCGFSNWAEGCYCDSVCKQYGDCCSNYDEMCNGGTPTEPAELTGCDGNCGGCNSAEGCYCDSVCKSYGDCCSNYDEMCLPDSEPSDPTGGCDGFCGSGNWAEGCYCDSVCKQYGDCCSNYDEMCNAGSDPADGGNEMTGCSGFCGGSNCNEGCYCDSYCMGYGDCCFNYEDVCEVQTQPPASGSCAGNCGGFNCAAGCYCDSYCKQYNDCCSDYDAQCAAVEQTVGVRPLEMQIGHAIRPLEMQIGQQQRPVELQIGNAQRPVELSIGHKYSERAVGEIAASTSTGSHNHHTLYISSGILALMMVSCIMVYHTCTRKSELDARSYLLAAEDTE